MSTCVARTLLSAKVINPRVPLDKSEGVVKTEIS